MRKAFAIWLMAGLPLLADSVAATRSWVSNRVNEARAEWRGEVVAATNPVPGWISASAGVLEGELAGATNAVRGWVDGATNGLPAKIAAVTNGLPEAIAGATNGLPAKIVAVTNGLPEAIIAATNPVPGWIAASTNGLPAKIAAVTNGLPEAIAASTNGLPESVAAATNAVMDELASATGAVWTAIGNIEGVTADIGALARTNDIPKRTSQLVNDSNFLTNHQSVAHLAEAAGVFPDWTSKAPAAWAEGEFCTYRGKVYRRSETGDGSTSPDISPASWTLSDVGVAISEANPDMSSLTNPIPSWIAASTNGLPERIAAATNGIPAQIAAVTNGIPGAIAGATNGIPAQIAAATNGIPEAIAASANELADSLTRLVADAAAGVELGDAFRLYRNLNKRSYMDGEGVMWDVYGAPQLLTGSVVVASLTSDTWFPTPAESVRLDEWGYLANPREWTNSQWTVTWGEEGAVMVDEESVTPEPGDNRRLLATKRFTLNDVEPNPSYQSSGYTSYLDGYALELWRHDIQVSMLYSSAVLTNGLATVALEFSDVRVAGGFEGTYSSCIPYVEWATNGNSVVITYGVDFVNVGSGGHGNIWQFVSVTRTVPKYLTFRPGTRTVQTGRVALQTEVESAIEGNLVRRLPLTVGNWRFEDVYKSANWYGYPSWPTNANGYLEGSLGFYTYDESEDVVIVTNGLSQQLYLYPYMTNSTHIVPYGPELPFRKTWRAQGEGDGYVEISAESDLVAEGYYNPYVTQDTLARELPGIISQSGLVSRAEMEVGWWSEWSYISHDTPYAPQDGWTLRYVGNSQWSWGRYVGGTWVSGSTVSGGENAQHLTFVDGGGDTVHASRVRVTPTKVSQLENDAGFVTADMADVAPIVAKVATNTLLTAVTETKDTWYCAALEGYADTLYSLVFGSGRWYASIFEMEDGGSFNIQTVSSAGAASDTTVMMSYSDTTLTFTKTGTATEDIPVYDFVAREVYTGTTGQGLVQGQWLGDWFDVETNSWRFLVGDHTYTSGGKTVRDYRLIDVADRTNVVTVASRVSVPEGTTVITNYISSWGINQYNMATSALTIVATPRSLNALGLARFSDLDRYAVPRQRLAEEVRRAVNLASNYLWDPDEEVCYRRQMRAGFLDYIAVTNIDLTLPENWQALEAVEAGWRTGQ